MFFDSWTALGRVILVGALAYVGLVILLRVSGKRTLSKMNAFDFVVTVALGSTLATVLLSKDVALADGLVALALLILMQFIVTWLSLRSESLQKLSKSAPRLLYYDGEFIEEALLTERVTREEARAAVRQHGHASMSTVLAIILETDGSMSVVSRTSASAGDPNSALRGVRGHDTGSR